MRGGTGNVLQFRRAKAPPLSLADSERRGVTSVASLNISAPSDSPHETEARAFAAATRLLHASESLGESLLRQRNDAIYWAGWLQGFAIGVLAISILALLSWPR